MATALLEGVVRADLPAPTVVPVLIGVGLAPVLLWRRTRPLLMAAVAFPVCAAGEAVVGGDLGLHTLAFLLILVFSLSRWGSGREAVLGGAVVAAKITLSVAADHLGPGDALAGAGVVSAALALGAALRYRARARQREFEQVKLLERERLARDLHDTVAHHVSAMAVRAQAGLAVLDTQPDAAADALRIIEAEATRALVEMRAMVRVLRRDEPADRAPAPRITDLERLASGPRTAWPSRWSCPATSTGCRRRWPPRSTGWPRNPSPTPADTPGARRASWCGSPATPRWCGYG